MKERATLIFPYAIAAALPLAGIILAGARYAEKRTYDANLLLAASLLGALIWALALTA